ncbi:MAG TPA: DUF3800 domain-containing protein [Bryobacteraceae bacterium]|nr:DUF3800 domain-containing protein [Bryobacteraceae bacterium]
MTDNLCYAVDSASASKIRETLEHIWWVLHHSDDPGRMAVALTCYLDESGTDSDSPVAVVGGLLLSKRQFFWLDVDWRKCLDKHHIPWPLHMREFGPKGKLKDMQSEQRRALFCDVAKIINKHKQGSAGARLEALEYKAHFAGVSKLSMYGACFTLFTIMVSVDAKRGGYDGRLAYVLDDGNSYKCDIHDARDVLLAKDSHMGAVVFDSDAVLAPLQAADVIAWALRRNSAEGLKSGFEPLADLFDDCHLEVPYKTEWMASVAESLRDKMEE